MFFVFDLDQTVADSIHRLHYIRKDPPDWTAYHQETFKDAPLPTLAIADAILQDHGHRVEFWSCRLEAGRRQTVKWLKAHLAKSRLYMPEVRLRHGSDRRSDVEIKWGFAQEHERPDVLFDDRPQVVEFFQRRGTQAFLVS